MNVGRNPHRPAMWAGMALALSALLGCGKPQAAPQNRALISALRTAVNTRNEEWLEKNAERVEEQRAAGKMGDEQYEAFQSIIAMAREGQWAQAEEETLAFLKAQRPTREEREQATKFQE